LLLLIQAHGDSTFTRRGERLYSDCRSAGYGDKRCVE
jgi:hypothetical protein